MELNVSEEPKLSCQVSSNLFLFTHRIELIHTHMHTCAHARKCQMSTSTTVQHYRSLEWHTRSLDDLRLSKHHHGTEIGHF